MDFEALTATSRQQIWVTPFGGGVPFWDKPKVSIKSGIFRWTAFTWGFMNIKHLGGVPIDIYCHLFILESHIKKPQSCWHQENAAFATAIQQ